MITLIVFVVLMVAIVAASALMTLLCYRESVKPDVEWWYTWGMRAGAFLYVFAGVGVTFFLVSDVVTYVSA